MEARIEKTIEIKAPVSKVWQALTDHRQFGAWFRVKLDGPFIAGQPSHGQNTYPGYEHMEWNAVVQAIEPEHYFAYTWHPYAAEPGRDYSQETPTLVEFRLEAIPDGTRITVTESGFDKIPPDRRSEAYRMHDNGWAQQLRNIDQYVTA